MSCLRFFTGRSMTSVNFSSQWAWISTFLRWLSTKSTVQSSLSWMETNSRSLSALQAPESFSRSFRTLENLAFVCIDFCSQTSKVLHIYFCRLWESRITPTARLSRKRSKWSKLASSGSARCWRRKVGPGPSPNQYPFEQIVLIYHICISCFLIFAQFSFSQHLSISWKVQKCGVGAVSVLQTLLGNRNDTFREKWEWITKQRVFKKLWL